MSECSLGVAPHTSSQGPVKSENKEIIQTRSTERPFVFVYNQEIYFLAPGMINQFTFTPDNSERPFQFIIEN